MRKQEPVALAPATTLGAREQQDVETGDARTCLLHAAKLLRASRYALEKPDKPHSGLVDSIGKLVTVIEHNYGPFSAQPQVAEGKEEKMIAEMKAMNDQWAAIHELLHTLPDDDWDEAPFVAIRELQNKQAVWIKTAERPPTEQDVGICELVLAQRCDEGCPGVYDLTFVRDFPQQFPFWMPIPPVPVEGQQKDLGER